jgi:uncharacterized Tic20 family protein
VTDQQLPPYQVQPQPGYAQQAGSYGPYPGPYGPYQAQVPQRAMSNRTAMWAHLGALLTWLAALVLVAPLSLFCFVTPLIIRSRHPADTFVRHHSTQSLNSCFTGLVVGVGGIVLAIIAIAASNIVMLVLVVVAMVVCAIARAVCEIVGSVKASHGERFTFPLWIAFRFMKDDTR